MDYLTDQASGTAGTVWLLETTSKTTILIMEKKRLFGSIYYSWYHYPRQSFSIPRPYWLLRFNKFLWSGHWFLLHRARLSSIVGCRCRFPARIPLWLFLAGISDVYNLREEGRICRWGWAMQRLVSLLASEKLLYFSTSPKSRFLTDVIRSFVWRSTVFSVLL